MSRVGDFISVKIRELTEDYCEDHFMSDVSMYAFSITSDSSVSAGDWCTRFTIIHNAITQTGDIIMSCAKLEEPTKSVPSNLWMIYTINVIAKIYNIKLKVEVIDQSEFRISCYFDTPQRFAELLDMLYEIQTNLEKST